MAAPSRMNHVQSKINSPLRQLIFDFFENEKLQFHEGKHE